MATESPNSPTESNSEDDSREDYYCFGIEAIERTKHDVVKEEFETLFKNESFMEAYKNYAGELKHGSKFRIFFKWMLFQLIEIFPLLYSIYISCVYIFTYTTMEIPSYGFLHFQRLKSHQLFYKNELMKKMTRFANGKNGKSRLISNIQQIPTMLPFICQVLVAVICISFAVVALENSKHIAHISRVYLKAEMKSDQEIKIEASKTSSEKFIVPVPREIFIRKDELRYFILELEIEYQHITFLSQAILEVIEDKEGLERIVVPKVVILSGLEFALGDTEKILWHESTEFEFTSKSKWNQIIYVFGSNIKDLSFFWISLAIIVVTVHSIFQQVLIRTVADPMHSIFIAQPELIRFLCEDTVKHQQWFFNRDSFDSEAENRAMAKLVGLLGNPKFYMEQSLISAGLMDGIKKALSETEKNS
ncbi:MAG: hypothetical protein MHMPM18_000987 [Marteilia pararefringens]